MLEHKKEVLGLFEQIKTILQPSSDESIAIFGEWIGPGIQPKIALSDLGKKYWIIFAACKADNTGEPLKWLDTLEKINTDSELIKNIYNFKN